jgi:hypothetical protein
MMKEPADEVMSNINNSLDIIIKDHNLNLIITIIIVADTKKN